MIKENDIILIYDGDKPFSFARIKLKYMARKPGEYYLETIMMGGSKELVCFLGNDGFFVNGNSMQFEPVTIKSRCDTTSGRKKLIQKNEVLLIYIDDQPTYFAQVEEILKAEKFCYYNLTIKFLTNPVSKQILTLRRKFVDGNEWKNQTGKMSRLEPVELNISNAELEKFRKKMYCAYLSSEGKKRQKNDIILLYYDDEALEYVRIEEILKDEKPYWHRVKLSYMRDPEKNLTYILRDRHINGEEFTMKGHKMRLELVEPPISSKEIADFYKNKSNKTSQLK